ncbi:MAG: hypothetical protein V4632_02200 [Pseudomonadota bacterium]
MLAGVHTVAHAAYLLTTPRARFTNRGTKLATLIMKMRTAQHEVGCGLANFRTICHQAEMYRLHVFPANFQAMCDRGMQADVMAFLAGVYAFSHFGMHWMLHVDLLRRVSFA